MVFNIFFTIFKVIVPCVFSPDKYLGIRNNGIYSVNCVQVACSSENIMIIGYCQIFDKRILLRFFYTMHSMLMLVKESNSLFYIRLLIYTNVLNLLINV